VVVVAEQARGVQLLMVAQEVQVADVEAAVVQVDQQAQAFNQGNQVLADQTVTEIQVAQILIMRHILAQAAAAQAMQDLLVVVATLVQLATEEIVILRVVQ
jgi:hypothetical protein